MNLSKSQPSDSSATNRGDAVTTVVRVRPFSERERQHQAKLVVHMPDEQTTSISDLSGGAIRNFTFDHSYWSHDNYVSDENGYFRARKGKRYADQYQIFNEIGVEILNNAWKGYNCCLFAYGQTGSGKSYSMVGYNHNKGIVPLICEELFRRIEQSRDAGDETENVVMISMMEIYCEKVRDLLGPAVTVVKIRENPKTGFYVDGLSNFFVESKRDIEHKILEGTQNRTIAATNLNEISSRAHTIIRITFVQKFVDVNGSGGTTKTSEINLVDLAGRITWKGLSERQKSTSHSENDRLKEGIIINKSLSVLGRVIKTLHENQQLQAQHTLGRARPAQVPYRDSVLTSLLKNALGGNSKTIMLATISPTDAARNETLSTLRFAERVKSVRTRAVVNESVTKRLLRELRAENTRLQELVQERSDMLKAVSSQEELQALHRQLSVNQRELATLERVWRSADVGTDTVNDQQSFLDEPKSSTKISESKTKSKRGSKTSTRRSPAAVETEADYETAGMEPTNRNSQMSAHEFLERRRRERPHLWNLNEDPALTDVILHFIDPGENHVGSGAGDVCPKIVMKGLSILPDHALLINKDNRRITLRPLNGAEILVNGQMANSDVELQQNDRVHFGGNHLYVFCNPFRPGGQTSAEIGYAAAQHEIVKYSHTLKFGADSARPRALSKEDAALEEALANVLPNVYRANAMAKAVGRDVYFEVVLLPPEMRATQTEGAGTEIWVKVQHNEQDTSFLWNQNRFASRYLGMQEIYAGYSNGDPDWSPPKVDRDPFFEPADTPTLIGTVRVFLQSLAYMVELDEQFAIIDVHGAECGQMCVSLMPSNVTSQEILGEFVKNPAELINQNLAFKVKILSALGLPRRIEESYCTYSFFDRAETQTGRATGSNPVYAHEELFIFRPVTRELIDYLTNGTLNIVISGVQKCKNMTLHNATTSQRISAYLDNDAEPQGSPTVPALAANPALLTRVKTGAMPPTVSVKKIGSENIKLKISERKSPTNPTTLPQALSLKPTNKTPKPKEKSVHDAPTKSALKTRKSQAPTAPGPRRTHKTATRSHSRTVKAAPTASPASKQRAVSALNRKANA